MVDDILLSPEEQDERAKKWLKENGLSIVIGVCVGLGLIFGVNQYRAKQQVQAEQASDLYQGVIELVKQSNLADIDELVSELKQNFSKTPYASKAVLINTKELAVSDLDAAATELKWVLEKAPEDGLKHIARIRLAQVSLEQGNVELAAQYANHKPHDGFASYYSELLGDIAAQSQHFEKAKQLYQQAIDSLGDGAGNYLSILNIKINQLPLTNDSVEDK